MLQLTQSIANWVGGGFNGGSLILCILMLGLLTLVGVGISKTNKLLTIVSGVSILSVVIYVLVNSYSGIIQKSIEGVAPQAASIPAIFACIATLLLIGSFILVILRAFKVTKNLKTINTVFSVIASVLFLVVIIAAFSTGFLSNSTISASQKVYQLARGFFGLFVSLLIPCVWHQVDTKE